MENFIVQLVDSCGDAHCILREYYLGETNILSSNSIMEWLQDENQQIWEGTNRPYSHGWCGVTYPVRVEMMYGSDSVSRTIGYATCEEEIGQIITTELVQFWEC